MYVRNRGGIKMPLFGCLAIIAVAFLVVVGITVAGWVSLRTATRSKPVSSSQSVSSSQIPTSSSQPSEIPFPVPDGYYARRISRELPCGKVVDSYIVVPLFEPPCN